MLPHLDCSLRSARVATDGDRLTVTTGTAERVWQWVGNGFATVSIRDCASGRTWAGPADDCDWQLPFGEPLPAGQVVALDAEVSDDEGFTTEHIAATATIDYPDAGLTLRFTVWAYPDAPGLRTQLSARVLDAEKLPLLTPGGQGTPPHGRVDRLPLIDPSHHRRLFGYYNETQQRNDTHQDLLEEHVVTHPLMGRERCDWASAACVEDATGGVALIKESHKCVNQKGYDGGGFAFDEIAGLCCDGWGLRCKEMRPDRLREAWATWSIVWSGGDDARQLAIKTFDRARYPVDPQRDTYIQANTWGSTETSQDARRAAGPESVLQEIEACADLGIDTLQIDDGWQVPPGHAKWGPEKNGWHPHPQTYPDGWTPIRERAAELGVKLGLWAAAEPVSLDELKQTRTEGGFVQYKLDFASLRNREQIEALMQKVRDFIKWSGHRVRVNWDVTENAARYGYFFAREYGCIYLENRKPVRPISTVYRPHTVLRDLWQLAKYVNLHRFQGSIQNVDRVDPGYSDAVQHPHAYATAITLMSIPLFFQETKYYSPDARNEIRGLLDIYKQHREKIYRGVVCPIGNKPDNASWTGFQSHLAEENSGYLTVFRERCNTQPTVSLRIPGLAGHTTRLDNLTIGASQEIAVHENSNVQLEIPDAPGFRFLRYEIVD